MSFVLYALLPEHVPSLSAEALLAEAKSAFADSKTLSATMETLPFSADRSVRLQWADGWSANLTYSVGAEVRNDSAEIARRLGKSAPSGLERIDRRVHVFFADDPNRLHTTQVVDVIQLLEDIEGAIVFDPQTNKLLSSLTG
jgi:hypothetical protein